MGDYIWDFKSKMYKHACCGEMVEERAGEEISTGFFFGRGYGKLVCNVGIGTRLS
jgi:hypothetical protein